MPEIKFCGITRRVDAEDAAALGVEYVGVVLAPSRRQMTLAAARELFSSLGQGPQRVGVFVDPSLDDVTRATETLGLTAVQVHGLLPANAEVLRERTGAQIWGAVGMGSPGSGDATSTRVAGYDVLLFDTAVQGAVGGNGRPFDWRKAQPIVDSCRELVRIAIAGGLRVDNVREAMQMLSPHLVDVSSGIEVSPGVKDRQRMSAFVAAVRGNAAA